MKPHTKALQTTEELAVTLRVRPATVRRWTRRGLIPVVRIGQKTLRFDADAVQSELAQRAAGGAAHA